MKNKNQKTGLPFIVVFCLASCVIGLMATSAVAQESTGNVSTTPAPKVPQSAAKNWKMDYAAYYYSFQGTHEANNDLYSFAKANLGLQLFTLSYQYSPNWTLMLIGQYLDNYVETNLFGVTYRDRTKGMGDTIAMAVTPIYLSSSVISMLDFGVSMPTGSINQENTSAPGHHLAYNMQSGSGTFDPMLGLTTIYLKNEVQIGSHLAATTRGGKNANDYHLGNLYKADAWLDYKTTFGLTPRLVGYYKYKDAVDGFDPLYTDRNALSEFYYHAQVNWDVSAAVKYTANLGPVAVSAELGKALVQGSLNVDNVVVSTEYFANLSASGNF